MKSHDSAPWKPDIYEESCSRVLFSGSGCDKCLSSCPSKAIHIGEHGLQIGDDCSGCGFCVAACPNEVFASGPGRPVSSENEKPTEVVYCSALLSQEGTARYGLPSTLVPCVGSISSSTVLGWVRTRERPMEVITEQCATCSRSEGEIQFRKRQTEIQALLDLLGIAFAPVIMRTGSASDRQKASMEYEQYRRSMERDAAFSRRDLFRHFQTLILKDERGRSASVSPGRPDRTPTETMRQVIALFQKHRECASRPEAISVLRDIQILESCNGCGSCARLCPTGALAFSDSGECAELLWTPAHCSGCDLCREACPRSAVRFMPGIQPEKIADEARTTLRHFQWQICQECGNAHISSGQGTRCSLCAKASRLMEDLSTMIRAQRQDGGPSTK